MVRTGTYKRKGGHGGDRSNNGLYPGFWEQQGGRQAAAAAKAKRTPEAKAKADEVKRQKRDFWQQWVAPSSTQQTTDSQQQSTQPTAEAEQPQPAQGSSQLCHISQCVPLPSCKPRCFLTPPN